MPSPTYTSICVSLVVVLSFLIIQHKKHKSLRLPPGPRGFPILGNALQLATAKFQWLTFSQWAKVYGDIIYFDALGQHIIVLDSMKAVTDLLENRSGIYSDRPTLVMLGELIGWEDWELAFMKYGPVWREHRRMFHQHFDIVTSRKYGDSYVLETRRTLQRLLESPDAFLRHIKLLTASTIMRAVYGLDVKDTNDPYLRVAELTMAGGVKCGVPGAFAVDALPILKYLPSWFPGAGFQKEARYWRGVSETFLRGPFEFVKSALANGTAVPSVLVDLLEANDGSPEYETVARNVTAIAYLGGSDTSNSSMSSFIAAMALYPEIQKKSQAELDRVIGRERLPDLTDKPNLPYIEAIVKEVLRWQPVTPLAVAHAVTEDDEYKGYNIPRGTIVIPNAWAILHNEKDYPDPLTFRPERFLIGGKLNPDILDPAKAAFGFGRRLCPGRYVAMNMIFIFVASVLTAFSIEPAMDENGLPVPVELVMSAGVISYPREFRCAIKPRSQTISSIIQQSLAV